MGEDNKVTVYGDYEAIPIFKRSKVMFCDGTFEKKKVCSNTPRQE